jgi:membrane dipeptidase
MWTRRQWLKNATIGAAAIATSRSLRAASGIAHAAAPMLNRGRYFVSGSPAEYSSRAIEIVGRATTIDMLSPLVISPSQSERWLTNPTTFTAGDFARYKNSSINVFHIAVGIGGPDAYLTTLKYFAAWDSFLVAHSDWFLRVDSPARLAEVKTSGKVGVILGLQNSEQFRTPGDVAYFYSLGQRVSQLTYNTQNLIGVGSTEREDSGITDFGVAVIGQMNKLGMAVDVSHCGDKTTLDSFDISTKPVLITHANCRALNPHPRCKTDEAIKKMAARGGVMGITGVRMFVTAAEPTTVEDVLNHYEHVAKLVGIEHVGVGSDIDLDGYDKMPEAERKTLHANYKSSYGFRDKDDIEGLNHPRRFCDIADGLIRRGYSDRDIEGVLGGNFQRVLNQIWSV